MKKFLAILLSATILMGGIGFNSVEASTKWYINSSEFSTGEYYQRKLYYQDFYINDSIKYYNQSGNKEYDALIIVNKNSLTSDGLSASGLIGATNGLLVPTNLKSGKFEIEHDDLNLYLRKKDLPDNIYIIGGAKAINPMLDSQFRKEGFNVKRIQGKNRIETSYNIAKEIKSIKNGDIPEMAITKAYNGEADAVSIASEAIRRKMPIILTNGSNLPKESPLGKEVKNIYAIGGSAVIKDSLVKQLEAERIGGKNRYETNANIIKRFGKHDGCTIVSGKNEELGNSLYAATMNSECPIVMTKLEPDKYIDSISGAKTIFLANKGISRGGAIDFLIASYGREVFNAYKLIEDINLKEIGLNNGNYLLYTPENSYLEGSSINPKDYIIFTPNNGYGEDSYELKYNIAVSKKDKKVYVMPEGNTEPIEVTDLLDK